MNKDLLVTLEYKKPSGFWRFFLWTLAILFLTAISLVIYLYVQSNKLVKGFTAGAEISREEFFDQSNQFLTALQSHYQEVGELPEKYNFLILGTDKLSGREGDPELTDSIMLLQLDFEAGEIKTLSLPRDLYNDDYQTKINALYFYGLEKYPDEPGKFPREVLTEMTDLKFDYTLVISIEDLEKLIALVGDIELDVPTAFTDPSFPIPGVDVHTVRDPKLLYEEISFETGLQTMDSATALKYMRSRYSEGDEGTDLARSARQQLVLEALASKLIKAQDPFLFGQLYRFYLDRFSKFLPAEEIAKLLSVYLNYVERNQATELTFVKHQLPIYPTDDNGVIYNPPFWQSRQQWIYQIKDQQTFKESLDAVFN